MEQRQLGQLEAQVSILGMGGLVVSERDQSDVNRCVADAFDRGITYFDSGPAYGNCEELLGPALSPYRSDIVLSCKTGKRDAKGAAFEMERSLERLHTEHFDIYQLHAIASLEELDTVLSDGGAIETLLQAKEEGKTQYIGFSAHSNEVAVQGIRSGHFDTILFPLNYNAYENHGVGKPVLEAARKAGMGVIAIKSMARTVVGKGKKKPYPKCWYEPEDRPEVARLQLRYTLSIPGVSAALPPGNPALFELAVSGKHLTKPLTAEEKVILCEAASGVEPVFGSTGVDV